MIARSVSRRALLALGGAAASLPLTAPLRAAPASVLVREDWRIFRDRFLDTSGRVVDSGNADISHSEGQGYGMLLALAFDDANAFLNMWRWTRTHLQVRDDALLAWRWQPTTRAVDDRNNATDGDLLVAWALLRANARWGEPAWATAALEILADVERLCVVMHGSAPLILPGVEGFVRDGGVIVNPAYWIFPALAAFAKAGLEGPWASLYSSGATLIRDFSAVGHGLVPDWCFVGDRIGPAEGFPFRFGYDAIRVPLYFGWAAAGAEGTALLEPYARHATRHGGPARTPATLDLLTGETPPYALAPGGQAVLQFVISRLTGAAFVSAPVSEARDYYDATLLLLTKLATMETRR